MSVKPSIYEKFIIESADGERTVDISRGVTAFFYYENLFSPYITARIIVTNTGSTIKGKDGKLQSLYNGLPVRGGERLQIKIAGNLKYFVHQKKSLDKNTKNKFKKRLIFCAASTHYNEELFIGKMHKDLRLKNKNLLTILIPRHANRSSAITNELKNIGLKIIKNRFL